MRRRDLLAATAGAIAATALAGGIAWAAIPGDGGVIQGCYDSGGNLKVVSALPCPKGYTALAWSQRGSKGDKGETGDPGNLALAGRSCPTGSFVTGFDSSGDVVCATPAGGGGGDDGGDEPGELQVSPLELVFASTPVGALSDALVVTFTNTTPFDVAVPTALTGENASDFQVYGRAHVRHCGSGAGGSSLSFSVPCSPSCKRNTTVPSNRLRGTTNNPPEPKTEPDLAVTTHCWRPTTAIATRGH